MAGLILLSNNSSEKYKQPLGTVLFVAGTGMQTAGIPLWISGGIKRRNNKKAMEELERLGLAIRASSHGIGLFLNF